MDDLTVRTIEALVWKIVEHLAAMNDRLERLTDVLDNAVNTYLQRKE